MVEETTTIRSGLIKRLHVDQHRVRQNTKDGGNRPVVTVQALGGPYKGHRAHIDGPSELVYAADSPLSCGARVWVETDAEVTVTVDDAHELKEAA